eukprot:390990-Hanusia_phi.AAC.3
MATARKTLGDKPISGNVDPLILMGKEEKIREAVRDCVHKARGVPHILNLGHGVIQPTPESAVSCHFKDTVSADTDTCTGRGLR